MTVYVVFAAICFCIYLLTLYLMTKQESKHYASLSKKFITNMEVVWCVIIAAAPGFNLLAAFIAIVTILIVLCGILSDSDWGSKPFFKQR